MVRRGLQQPTRGVVEEDLCPSRTRWFSHVHLLRDRHRRQRTPGHVPRPLKSGNLSVMATDVERTATTTRRAGNGKWEANRLWGEEGHATNGKPERGPPWERSKARSGGRQRGSTTGLGEVITHSDTVCCFSPDRTQPVWPSTRFQWPPPRNLCTGWDLGEEEVCFGECRGQDLPRGWRQSPPMSWGFGCAQHVRSHMLELVWLMEERGLNGFDLTRPTS